jgi:DNA-directed RNA polymerase subunit RPC12/RpoP
VQYLWFSILGGIGMEKKEIVCPHCGKKKAKIEIKYRSGGLVDEVKVKGFDWFPTIKAI